jgi:SpoVK/Ycf46/Vps4 family AAA+-type ATPase
VLQYWKRPEGWQQWTRKTALEIALPEMSEYLERHHRPEVASGTVQAYDPSAGWEDLGLPQETVDQLRKIAKMVREREVLAPRNLMLFGPQECNKTEPVRQMARETRRPLIVADVAEVMSGSADHATQKVAALFAHARARTPCILFFDDIEQFAAQQGTPLSVEASTGVVSQLVVEIENNCEANRDVFLVAATVRPDAVDSAIRSHIPLHIEVPAPRTGERGSPQ